MKKIIAFVLSLTLLLTLTNVKAETLNLDKPEVTGRAKINIYLFRGEGCSHCYDFLTYFYKNRNDLQEYFDKYVNIVAFETWKDTANQALRAKVNERFEIKDTEDDKRESAVPLVIVGDWYDFGFGDSSAQEIMEKAIEAYQNEDYVDEVNKIIKDNDLETNPETLEEACKKEGIISNSGMVIGVIFGVLLLGLGAVIVLANKK